MIIDRESTAFPAIRNLQVNRMQFCHVRYLEAIRRYFLS